jgi:hypothetical protein
MKRTIITLVLGGAVGAAVVAAPALSSSSSASTWRVVKSKTVTGQFATTAISATIKHPRGIAVRFIGIGVHGTATSACTKGFSISSYSHSWGRGLHVLGHVRGKTRCDVIASVGGSGRVRVQILKWV